MWGFKFPKRELNWLNTKVLSTINTIKNHLNPFTIYEQKLYILSSGSAVSDQIAKDTLGAEETGRKMRHEFITQRLELKAKNFFDPIHRVKLKTIGIMSNKVKLTSKNNKIIECKSQGNILVQLLAKTRDLKLDLKDVMTYCLTPVNSIKKLERREEEKAISYFLAEKPWKGPETSNHF